MSYLFTSDQFVSKLLDVAKNHKTLYIMGCFGAPMSNNNKVRYCNNHNYNRSSARQKMIQASTADTFGFDCVGLVKGILWGWDGDVSRTYGGAGYKANNVPDADAKGMLNYCSKVSTNFSNIKKGEFLWMDGHCGVYCGKDSNGRHYVIESTPKWDNCVQISYISNLGETSGHCRTWTKHGQLKWIDYSSVTTSTPTTSTPASTATSSTPNSVATTYTVKSGDTLSKIAQAHNMTLEEILALNPTITNPNLINVGLVLKLKLEQKTYTVQSGDYLAKIGKNLGVNWSDIAKANNIKFPYIIHKGDVLIIP